MGFWDLIERKHCLICGDVIEGAIPFCVTCALSLAPFKQKGSICPRCHKPVYSEEGCCFCETLNPSVLKFRAFYPFEGVHKRLLHLYKKGHCYGLADFYAQLVENQCILWDLADPLLVPIPPRFGKMRYKGWDQVDLITKKMTYQVPGLLRRCDKQAQKTLNREERFAHMEANLRVRQGVLKRRFSMTKRPILLIDDVWTTGSTLNAACALIASHCSNPIYIVCLCQVY